MNEDESMYEIIYRWVHWLHARSKGVLRPGKASSDTLFRCLGLRRDDAMSAFLEGL